MIRSPLYYSGDKFKVLDQIIPNIDENARFFDLFVGGGSILANVRNKKIIASDSNGHVIELLQYLKDNSSSQIIKNLKAVAKKYGLTTSAFQKYSTKGEKKYFANANKAGHAKLREDYNLKKQVKLLFPLVIYSYNRLLRFNSGDKYNVPVGTLDMNKNVIKHITEFTESIDKKDITLINSDYKEVANKIRSGDVVFVDPPYIVSNAEYNSGWGLEDEKELYKTLENLIEKGATVLVTNYASRGSLKNLDFKKFYKNKKKIKLRSFHYSFHDNKGNESIEYLVIGGHNV